MDREIEKNPKPKKYSMKNEIYYNALSVCYEENQDITLSLNGENQDITLNLNGENQEITLNLNGENQDITLNLNGENQEVNISIAKTLYEKLEDDSNAVSIRQIGQMMNLTEQESGKNMEQILETLHAVNRNVVSVPRPLMYSSNNNRVVRKCGQMMKQLWLLTEHGNWSRLDHLTNKALTLFKNDPDMLTIFYCNKLCTSAFYLENLEIAETMSHKAMEILPETVNPLWHLGLILSFRIRMFTRQRRLAEAQYLIEQAHQAASTLAPSFVTGTILVHEGLYLNHFLRCHRSGINTSTILQRIKTCFQNAILHFQQDHEIAASMNHIILFLALLELDVDFINFKYLNTVPASEANVSEIDGYLTFFEKSWDTATPWSKMFYYIARAEQHKRMKNLQRCYDYFSMARDLGIERRFEDQMQFINESLTKVEDSIRIQTLLEKDCTDILGFDKREQSGLYSADQEISDNDTETSYTYNSGKREGTSTAFEKDDFSDAATTPNFKTVSKTDISERSVSSNEDSGTDSLDEDETTETRATDAGASHSQSFILQKVNCSTVERLQEDVGRENEIPDEFRISKRVTEVRFTGNSNQTNVDSGTDSLDEEDSTEIDFAYDYHLPVLIELYRTKEKKFQTAFLLKRKRMKDLYGLSYCLCDCFPLMLQNPIDYLSCCGAEELKIQTSLQKLPFDIICDSRIQIRKQKESFLKSLLRSAGVHAIPKGEQTYKINILDAALLLVAKCKQKDYFNLLAFQLLVKSGACINACDGRGSTPLRSVILEGKCLFVHYLLQYRGLDLFCEIQMQDYLSLSQTKREEDITKAIIWHYARRHFEENKHHFDYLNVWPGHRYPVTDSTQHYEGICLVAQFDGIRKQPLDDTFHKVQVVWRQKYQVSSESEYVASLEKDAIHDDVYASEGNTACVSSKIAQRLFRLYSNLNIISQTIIKSRNYNKPNPKTQVKRCIALYCRIKGVIPIGEKPFPSKIGSLATDVREGYCIFGANGPKDYQINMKYGNCVGPLGDNSMGSLGGFVEHQGQDYFITCAHVLYEARFLRQRHFNTVKVVQPPISLYQYSVEQRVIGETEKTVFISDDWNEVSVDAALVKISKRPPIDGTFPYETDQKLSTSGYSLNHPPVFFSGEILETIPDDNIRSNVIKFGAETGLTCGTLNLEKTHVRIENKELKVMLQYTRGGTSITPSFDAFTMYGQYEVFSNRGYSFFDLGDSGSFAYLMKDNKRDDLKCIGMCIGKTSYGSCLITPISNILESFGLPLKLKKFGFLPTVANATSPIQQDEAAATNPVHPHTAGNVEILLQQMMERFTAVEQKLANVSQELKELKDEKQSSDTDKHCDEAVDMDL